MDTLNYMKKMNYKMGREGTCLFVEKSSTFFVKYRFQRRKIKGSLFDMKHRETRFEKVHGIHGCATQYCR